MQAFHLGAFFSFNICTITAAAAAVSQLPTSQAIGLLANSTAPSLPANSVNLSAEFHYFVPQSTIRIDFRHQAPDLAPEDVLMCLVLGLSRAYGHAATERLPQFNSHFSSAFVHIEDLDPTPGKEYSYGSLVTTLRGIGQYMAIYDRYLATFFRIYDISDIMEESLIGTGGIANNPMNNVSVTSAEGLGAAIIETPASTA